MSPERNHSPWTACTGVGSWQELQPVKRRSHSSRFPVWICGPWGAYSGTIHSWRTALDGNHPHWNTWRTVAHEKHPCWKCSWRTVTYGKDPALEQGKSARKKDLRGECYELTTALIPHPPLVEDVGELWGEAEPVEGRDRVFDGYQASQGQPTTIKKMLWTQRELQALQEQSQVWYQNGKAIFLYQAHQMSSCAAPFQAAGPGAAASGVQLWLTQQCHRSQALAGDISAKLMALPGFLNLLAEFCLVISIHNWESGYLGLLFLARA